VLLRQRWSKISVRSLAIGPIDRFIPEHRMRTFVIIGLGVLVAVCGHAAADEPISHLGGDPYQAAVHDPYLSPEASYVLPDPVAEGGACNRCCGHEHGCLDRLLWGRLPNPHHSRCDMPLHIPYIAEPKFYYYFRPYNWFHIPVQQDEARAIGLSPYHPYDNRIFQSVYERFHYEAPPAEILSLPPAAEARPESASELRSVSMASDVRQDSEVAAEAPSKGSPGQRPSVRLRPVLDARDR
jgi:hypothetical protein